jgi:hypothetical protein
MRKPCSTCAKVRKFLPKSIARQLEALERRRIEESKKKDASRQA